MYRLRWHWAPVLATVMAMVILLLVPTARAHAQASPPPQGRVIGTVVDTSNYPLSGVTVSTIGETRSVRTDTAGRFGITASRGVALLNVRALGYIPVNVDISALEGRPLRIILKRAAYALDTVRVRDRNGCATITLAGFDCRRASGIGYFRDSGELRGMKPKLWADMFDGFPELRRYPTRTPHGWDVRVQAPPSQCLVDLWNGQPRMILEPLAPATQAARSTPTSERREGSFDPDDVWLPNDVVAIEYYDDPRLVPEKYKRFAVVEEAGHLRSCRLIIYWLRGATKR